MKGWEWLGRQKFLVDNPLLQQNTTGKNATLPSPKQAKAESQV